ncbi:TRM32 protein [Spatholobus suberectus]|nr:TRM32 protein [Spatholobus suberectus]
MGRKIQHKHSDSYWVNHDPECSRTLFHIIKYHPLLCHFFERLAYKRGRDERSAAGNVLVFSAERKKELDLVVTRNSNVEKKMTPYSSFAKDSIRSQIKAIVVKEISKKRNRYHRSSTCPLATINMNKNLLTTFLQDPVSPLVRHLHKQQVYGSKMTLTRSISFPLPDSSSKRQCSGATGNDYLPKGKGKLCFDNKTPKSVQFESSKKFYVRSIASGARCFNVNEAMMVRDVKCSSVSAQGQNQNEIKQFKNLKQKIQHVTGESRKEKLRVTMDAVIHKLPQGHGISNDLKKEIFKKLTDPNITRKGEYYHESSSESDHSTPSFTKHHRHNIRRIWSLQEPLEIYWQLYENRFNTEPSHLQSKRLKLAEKAHSPLRRLIPLQRMRSLPDLQSFSYAYQNGEFPDISSVTEPITASGDGTMSSENIAYQKKRLDLNLPSKSQLQLDTPVENLIQKHLVSVGENDLVMSNIVEPGSDCSREINGKVGMTTDDFGHSCLKSGGTFNDQDIEPIKECKTAIAASVDSKSNLGPSDKLDKMAEQQEAIMDFLKVKETTENAQKVEIQSKQLNYGIPLFHGDTRDKAEFNYVKYVLEISGLTGKECLSAWHSRDHPVDPLLYEEMEGDPDFCSYGGSGQCNHHVLFDLINETLLELSGRSYCYCPIPLSSSLSHTHSMPKGCHNLHQVWIHMSKSLCLRSKADLTIDDHVSRDLERRDGWVNLQLFDQCVGLELEDLIFHDLLEEITSDLACI